MQSCLHKSQRYRRSDTHELCADDDVATPTMAAAAVPSAACARHRLGVERPRLTVVIVFLQLLLLASAYVKAARCGRGCRRC
jgi:hypothetical protein